jgi:hypothetical protein
MLLPNGNCEKSINISALKKCGYLLGKEMTASSQKASEKGKRIPQRGAQALIQTKILAQHKEKKILK